MAEEYDYDADGVIDLDDGWLYVEDEFDLADELAEGQVPEPGYSGTNSEIEMESYEFDLFGYFDDLDYGDDSYWDNGSFGSRSKGPGKGTPKRKRDAATQAAAHDKRRKVLEQPLVGESEPMVFKSQEERFRSYTRDAPLLGKKTAFSFLADWKERFADKDGIVAVTSMPAAMRKAAEAKDDGTPPKARQLVEKVHEDGDDGWEDDEVDEMDEEGEDGIDLDPEMLKTILRERLGAAGLDGMDEAAFMQTIQKMMSGDGDGDDAADDLADSLLGKLTSGAGDEALSRWLSQQGVALEEDDTSSVATADVAEGAKSATSSKHVSKSSPPDSAVGVNPSKVAPAQIPLHSGSPIASSKKRPADDDTNENSTKKHRKVQFEDHSIQPAPDDHEENATAAAVRDPTSEKASQDDGTKQKGGRKRKAPADENMKTGAKKKTHMRELQDLGPLPEAPSPAPPAKRTRSARKAAK